MDGLVVNLSVIAELLTDDGLYSYVEQTGGGVATVYVFDHPQPSAPGWHRNRAAALIGPGWFEPGWLEPDAIGWVEWGTFCFGADDDGEGPVVESDEIEISAEESPEGAVARAVAAFVRGDHA